MSSLPYFHREHVSTNYYLYVCQSVSHKFEFEVSGNPHCVIYEQYLQFLYSAVCCTVLLLRKSLDKTSRYDYSNENY